MSQEKLETKYHIRGTTSKESTKLLERDYANDFRQDLLKSLRAAGIRNESIRAIFNMPNQNDS